MLSDKTKLKRINEKLNPFGFHLICDQKGYPFIVTLGIGKVSTQIFSYARELASYLECYVTKEGYLSLCLLGVMYEFKSNGKKIGLLEYKQYLNYLNKLYEAMEYCNKLQLDVVKYCDIENI